MLIQCTKKLLDQIKQDPVADSKEEALFSWHANILTINRRKTIVLLNDLNKYIIVLYGVKANEFKKLDEVIVTAVRKSFLAESIKEEIIDSYLAEAGEVKFTKTSDRSLIGGLTIAGRYLSYHEDALKENSIYQPEISARLSRLIVNSPGGKDYITPNEELCTNLEQRWSVTIFGGKAVQLHVSLDLDDIKVWRRLIVPANISFDKFHEILQIVFQWKDYHLYEFYIFGEEKFEDLMLNYSGYHPDRYKPIMILTYGEEAFEFNDDDEPMKLASEAKLTDYLPAQMKYTYDFGDNWQHFIKVEKIIDQYQHNYPVCLDGAGNSPPEDIGGVGGYEEFLRIINDRTDPDHQYMVDWSNDQGYGDFNITSVNRQLKRL